MIGGKSFIVDDEGNEEELETVDSESSKPDSKLSLVSGESGFNEDHDNIENTNTTQLLYTREHRKSFTQSFSYDTNEDKSAC